MDEPSTGLDPASRNSLWNVVKHAKQHRAIVLTSKISPDISLSKNISDLHYIFALECY